MNKSTLTKDELASTLASKTGMTVTSSLEAINVVAAAIQEGLAGGRKVELRGFGCFSPKFRAARTGRDPRNAGGPPLQTKNTLRNETH